MKRILCLILTLALALPVCILPAAAADAAITAENVEAKPGETVKMTVSVSGGAEIAGLVLTVKADERLELKSAVNGTALGGFSSGKNLVWVPNAPTAAEGTLTVLTFVVPDTLSAGTYKVELALRECLDADMNDLPLRVTPGSIKVEAGAAGENPAGGEDPTEPPLPTAMPFIDVAEKDFFHDAVLWAVGKKITSGTDEKHFGPYLTCTRAQTVTFLWRAAGCPEPKTTNCPFTDVDLQDYYGKAVLWAVEKGIAKGVSDTLFCPGKTVSRAQAVTFLYRYAGAKPVSARNPFTDVKADSAYRDAILWAYANGITSGTSANAFSPGTACTRGQVVTFLYRLASL